MTRKNQGSAAVETAVTEVETAAETAVTEPTDEPRTVEAWRASKGTPDWLFAAAKTLHSWAIGRLLTESEYDAGVDAAAHMPISGHPITPIRTKRRK